MFECKYGYFTDDGREYVITRPDTPKPWINIISNGNYGITVSQSGTGYSWLENSNLNRITRFNQDMVEDGMGKFIYIRDNDKKDYWSAAWKPVCREYETYECRHGIGFSKIIAEYSDIRSCMTVLVSPDESVELMILKLKNLSKSNRRLSIISYIEWNLDVYNFENREFKKIFIDNDFNDELDSFITTSRLWTIPNEKRQNMNRSWEYTAFHSSSSKPASFDGDRESFIGMYGNKAKPRALELEYLEKNQGKWVDSIASLQLDICLLPEEEEEVVFTIGAAKEKQKAEEIIKKYKDVRQAYKTLENVKAFWELYLNSSTVKTPDKAMNISTNIWLKYQTISCRLWSRTAYYQSGGAYGFRDQLQDSQLFLSFMPELTKQQILLHAAHQYSNGTVKHWWHPISEEGPDSDFSDDLLWLPFVVNAYIRETEDYSILDIVQPFLDGGNASIYEHCKKSLECSFHRFSPRGIPLIGEADWNDGLSGCGTEWIGESIWVGEFLYLIAKEFAKVAMVKEDYLFAERCGKVCDCLKDNINRHGWDGEWYIQCTTDTGKTLGSRKNREGKIFLNPQVWSVLSGIVPEERLKAVIRSIKKYLLKDYGPLLLYPAYSEVDKDIGYLTRYAPGVRENGGVYTHAAVWAIQMFCQIKDARSAYDIFTKLCPINRHKDISRYRAEPYVLPGNTDGPCSPNYGQGGWTWYTGSAAWLFRVVNEYILGIRPVCEGLLVDPCIPAEWEGYTVNRLFRGCLYRIQVANPQHISHGIEEICINGRKMKGCVIPLCQEESSCDVKAVMGTPALKL